MVRVGCRGRSAWQRPGQTAELAVRERTGEERAEALSVAADSTGDGQWTVRVCHADGRAWWVEVAQRTSTPPRPESCGKTPVEPVRMAVLTVREAAGTTRRA